MKCLIDNNDQICYFTVVIKKKIRFIKFIYENFSLIPTLLFSKLDKGNKRNGSKIYHMAQNNDALSKN